MVAVGPGWGNVRAAYPDRPIRLIVPWGAGGTTDRTARTVAPVLERALGVPVVVVNMPGATGAIGAQYVHEQPPDGYTLLFSAENTAIYRVLGISSLSFGEFEPVMLFTQGVPAIMVKGDSRFKAITELLQYAREHPEQVTIGATGVGGVPYVVQAMLSQALGIRFKLVHFDGDGPAIAALLGGHVDATIPTIPAAIEYHRAGRARILATVTNQRLAAVQEIPALGESYPELRRYLPWGPFFGLWAPKGTAPAVIQRLAGASRKVLEDSHFAEFARDQLAVVLGLAGDEARRFVGHWESTTSWLLWDSGAAKQSPEAFGIPRPGGV